MINQAKAFGYFTDDDLLAIAAGRVGGEPIPEFSTNNNTTMQTNSTVEKLGIDNPILDFGPEGVHFGSKFDAGRKFSMQIINSATSGGGDNGVRSLRLFAGLDQLVGAGTVAGLLKDGNFNDAGGSAGLSGVSQEAKTILALQKYLSVTPTVLKGMHVQFSDPTQAGNAFVFKYDDPFTVKPDRTLRPSTAYNQNTNNTNYLLIDNIEEILNGQTFLDYKVAPGVTVTITLYFGASIDLTKTLRTFKKDADATIAVVGQAAIDTMDKLAMASQVR